MPIKIYSVRETVLKSCELLPNLAKTNGQGFKGEAAIRVAGLRSNSHSGVGRQNVRCQPLVSAAVVDLALSLAPLSADPLLSRLHFCFLQAKEEFLTQVDP